MVDQHAKAIAEHELSDWTPPSDTGFFEQLFRIKERGSSIGAEVRAGCVLFMTSAYILFLNPLILSGASSGTNTGMPSGDIALATAVSSGLGTLTMGLVANYPWVVSVQLGTNTYFVNNLLQPGQLCGYHGFMQGFAKEDNTTKLCSMMPCSCTGPGGKSGVPDVVGTAANPGPCFGTTGKCLGTKIPYEKALAATFLEGVVFLFICFSGLRGFILKFFPKSVLMAGSCGIGIFIAFVGIKGMGLIVAAPYPTLLQLNADIPYKATAGGWGSAGYHSGVGFNDCELYFDGAPFGPVCPWLSIGGLIFTGILMVWNINGAFIIGIFFTMFISWIKFPGRIGDAENPGLVPQKVAAVPKWETTAGALNFNWTEDGQLSDLIGALFTFLYLDFIGSCITFVAMGEMMGLLNERGDIPRSNFAFIADGFASMMGGLLGSSALTTYVESAAAVREGGRTGLTAVVCALFFFASVFLSPLFSNIPDIATSPILVLIGVLIFVSSVYDVNWNDLTDAIPAIITMLGMPFTSNIAYGIIGGIFAYVIAKFFTFQLFDFQKSWPGYNLYKKWTTEKSAFLGIPGWNVHKDWQRPPGFGKFMDEYKGLEYFVDKYFPGFGGANAPTPQAVDEDDLTTAKV